MTTWLIAAAVLAYILAGAFNGAMDTLLFHYSQSIFPPGSKFWNPRESWRNKWKNGDPTQGEKFPGSSTIMVGFTDGWHLMQMGYLACQRLAIVLGAAAFTRILPGTWANVIAWAIVWVALIFVHSAGFHATYSKILKR
jgi:hypothetical protein